jgi:hypothetical protein
VSINRVFIATEVFNNNVPLEIFERQLFEEKIAK